MNDIDLENMWQAYDKKLEEARVLNLQSWMLNVQSFEHLQHQKASNKLKAVISFKAFAIAAGIVWVIFLVHHILNSLTVSKLWFVLSAGMIALITAAGIIAYLVHIVWIQQINNSSDIVTTQQQLSRLQSSTLWITRILFLQLPFYTTWFLSAQLLAGASIFWLIFQVTVTLSFTLLSLWLYKNISYKNMHKKWFRLIFSGREWTHVADAIAFIKEIEAFKTDKLNA